MATARMMLRIEGMTCDGCSRSIEQALSREQGVSERASPGRRASPS